MDEPLTTRNLRIASEPKYDRVPFRMTIKAPREQSFETELQLPNIIHPPEGYFVFLESVYIPYYASASDMSSSSLPGYNRTLAVRAKGFVQSPYTSMGAIDNDQNTYFFLDNVSFPPRTDGGLFVDYPYLSLMAHNKASLGDVGHMMPADNLQKRITIEPLLAFGSDANMPVGLNYSIYTFVFVPMFTHSNPSNTNPSG